MKVQSSQLIKMVEGQHKVEARVVPLRPIKAHSHAQFVMDGPFAETKESCSYVRILSARTNLR